MAKAQINFGEVGGGSGTLCVTQDIQNASNEGNTIDLGFAPDFLYVCAAKTGGYADTYYYYKDENGTEIQHYIRVVNNSSGRYDDTLSAIWWSSDKTQFRFHGAGGTSGVYYNVYWGKGFTIIPST